VSEYRSGLVGLAGRPNVGKSTLTNALCGSHVAIVSDKPQTTRRRLLGVVHAAAAQVVLVDLPGFQKPFDELTRRMQGAVDEALGDVDVVVVVFDATLPLGGGDRFVAGRAFAAGVPVVIVLNKVDLLDPARIAAAIEPAAALGPFHALHPVSARTGDGVEALRDELVALLPEGPPYFAPGVDSDQPLALRIAELVREQALERTREEVPHAVAVAIEEVEPPRGRRAGRVVAALVVETESQRRILIGSKGSVVRAIGAGARPEIERLLGGTIYLDLSVKVRPRWRRDAGLLDRFGL
jgi:GTP-binding protein Era